MMHPLVWDEVEWGLQKMSLNEFGRAPIVGDDLAIDHGLADPCWTLLDIEITKEFSFNSKRKSWIMRKNLVWNNKCIIVPVSV